MIDLESLDSVVLRSMRGLDVFDAVFVRQTGAEPVECVVARDTLELVDEFGVKAIHSGAEITYIRSEVGDPPIGSWFEFDGGKWVVEDKVSSQDSNMRAAHCRREPLT